MRITHAVRSDAFAGVERYMATVAVELAARGHEVHVIGGAEAQMTGALGSVRWTPAPTTTSLVQVLRKSADVDVLHVHMTAAEFAASVAGPFRGAPIVATRHFAQVRGRGIAGAVVRTAIRSRLSVELAISEFVARSVDGTPTVLHNGVPDQRLADGARRHRVVVLNRLEPEKDVATAIRAWARSSLPGRGWRLAIAGTGSLRGALERQAVASGHADTIDFLGFVDDSSTLLRSASALVTAAPSEPFGLAVAEAMAVATPVLAADGGAHPELVGTLGWTFPPGDSAALAALLDQLAAEPAAAHRYGLRLAERQRALFGIGHHVDALEAVYFRVARPGRRDRPGVLAGQQRGSRARRRRTGSDAR